jgi:hemolysin type calcium-binding protein
LFSFIYVMNEVSHVPVGTGGADRLVGTSAADGILALGGNDVLLGGSAGDGLCGGDANDQLSGEAGPDFLDGGGGADTCAGGTESDQAVRCETISSIPLLGRQLPIRVRLADFSSAGGRESSGEGLLQGPPAWPNPT